MTSGLWLFLFSSFCSFPLLRFLCHILELSFFQNTSSFFFILLFFFSSLSQRDECTPCSPLDGDHTKLSSFGKMRYLYAHVRGTLSQRWDFKEQKGDLPRGIHCLLGQGHDWACVRNISMGFGIWDSASISGIWESWAG